MDSSVLIVPLRDFDTAKSRLSEFLTAQQRGALARTCARRVLERSVECHRVVVCDSDDVESWSTDLGVDTVRVLGSGLNGALAEALPIICGRHPGSDLVIAHGDIVDPMGLDDLVRIDPGDSPAHVVIVPDRRDDGTNVVRLAARIRREWVFEYGPGSFTRHLSRAKALGWTTIVHRNEGLASDIDTPEDLSLPEVRSFLAAHFPEWRLPEILEHRLGTAMRETT